MPKKKGVKGWSGRSWGYWGMPNYALANRLLATLQSHFPMVSLEKPKKFVAVE
jgi:hypothetical protein